LYARHNDLAVIEERLEIEAIALKKAEAACHNEIDIPLA
jgi:hypothetical protein